MCAVQTVCWTTHWFHDQVNAFALLLHAMLGKMIHGIVNCVGWPNCGCNFFSTYRMYSVKWKKKRRYTHTVMVMWWASHANDITSWVWTWDSGGFCNLYKWWLSQCLNRWRCELSCKTTKYGCYKVCTMLETNSHAHVFTTALLPMDNFTCLPHSFPFSLSLFLPFSSLICRQYMAYAY